MSNQTFKSHKGRADFYRDEGGEWRWRVTARNGRCLSVSSEGYKNLGDCKLGLTSTAYIANSLNWGEPLRD